MTFLPGRLERSTLKRASAKEDAGIGTGIQFGANTMKTLINLWNDESGASAAEYALILAIVGSGIAIAAITLGGAIGDSLEGTANEIKNCTGATVPTSGC